MSPNIQLQDLKKFLKSKMLKNNLFAKISLETSSTSLPASHSAPILYYDLFQAIFGQNFCILQRLKVC